MYVYWDVQKLFVVNLRTVVVAGKAYSVFIKCEYAIGKL